MEWMIDKERPICPQINEQIAARIALGEFRAGERLSSVRDVAVAAGVNPNTVQKAFESLEAEGLIYSVRGSGWFVSDAREKAGGKLRALGAMKAAALVKDLKSLGFGPGQILSLIREEVGQDLPEGSDENMKEGVG